MVRHAPPDESPVATLRRTAVVFAREYMENREQYVSQQKIIQTSPALLAREREIDRIVTGWRMRKVHPGVIARRVGGMAGSSRGDLGERQLVRGESIDGAMSGSEHLFIGDLAGAWAHEMLDVSKWLYSLKLNDNVV